MQCMDDRGDSSRLFNALDHDARRSLLRSVCERPDRTCDLDERLAECTSDEATPESLAVRWYHLHLPKLARNGLVEYDWGAREVRYVGDIDPDRVQRFIDEEW